MSDKYSLAFINTEDVPVKTNHISYTIADCSDGDIELIQIVEEYYKHPEAPESALLPILKLRSIRKHHRLSKEAAPLILLEAQEKTMRLIEKGRFV